MADLASVFVDGVLTIPATAEVALKIHAAVFVELCGAEAEIEIGGAFKVEDDEG
jgi:hypothetical protein